MTDAPDPIAQWNDARAARLAKVALERAKVAQARYLQSGEGDKARASHLREAKDFFAIRDLLETGVGLVLALREARQQRDEFKVALVATEAARAEAHAETLNASGRMMRYKAERDDARQKLAAANEMTQFCHDHHDIDLAVLRLVAEQDALKAMLTRWDAWWYSGTNNPEPHPADGLAAQSRALLSGESHP